MKQRINIAQANIDNLISLWQAASRPFEGCFQSGDLNYCYIENSDWPNRLWLQKEITADGVEAAKQIIYSAAKSLVVPCSDNSNTTSHQLLENAGFQVKSVQVGMSLEIRDRPEKRLRLQFERVCSTEGAKLWAEVYPKAFGYQISEEIPARSHGDIEFYLASYLGELAGTAMIYKTGDVVGIHGVGIIPEMRRRGFAEEIMEFALNRAVSLEASYVTLQASVMGKGLYDKLGFKEDFTLKNYTLNQDN